jgi:signal transduction histidine kinase
VSNDPQRRFEETAAAVAHELGTPLAVAQAAIEALRKTASTDEAVMLVDAALRSLRSIELQVARLRRLEGATDELARRPVDLVALARELIDDLDASLLHEHPTGLDAPDRLVAVIDPDKVRQVLYNLLSNAAKYSPPGRDIVITIASTDEGAVVLQVRDRGDGVAPENAERIFDKYERLEREPPGAGLGLYLSRLVVEEHGGTLRLQPAEGEGSIFELILPTGRADGAEEASPPTSAPSG